MFIEVFNTSYSFMSYWISQVTFMIQTVQIFFGFSEVENNSLMPFYSIHMHNIVGICNWIISFNTNIIIFKIINYIINIRLSQD